jgi:LysM repeat protein
VVGSVDVGQDSRSTLPGVDRICPFLALSDDHRTAIDGFDPAHACHARQPAVLVDRVRQAELCLVEAHRQCEFYTGFLAERGSAAASFPVPAADAHLARTRMVVEPEPWHARLPGEAPFGLSGRRWLVAGGIAAAGVAVAATAIGGGFNGLVADLPATPTSLPTQVPVATPSPPSPTPLASPPPTQRPATPTPAPTATPRQRTPAPTPRTYVVQAGDTLSLIAIRFGTSVTALQAANGLGKSDVINIGQVLIIP